MLIASLNAWGGAVYTELARWLSGTAFDVICLQESPPRPARPAGRRFDVLAEPEVSDHRVLLLEI